MSTEGEINFAFEDGAQVTALHIFLLHIIPAPHFASR